MAVKKSKKNSHFLIYMSYLKTMFLQQLKKGVSLILFMEGIQKRYLFCQKLYIEGEGVLAQGRASEYNPLFSNTLGPLSLISPFTLTYFMIFVVPGLLFCGIMQLFGHLLLLTKETMKKVCVCLAST